MADPRGRGRKSMRYWQWLESYRYEYDQAQKQISLEKCRKIGFTPRIDFIAILFYSKNFDSNADFYRKTQRSKNPRKTQAKTEIL
uniref:Uncharacterized protein n=1 Tax=Romanomermis culicivorax TaxID=13658 RepID=A0A915KWE4_ROMCU